MSDKKYYAWCFTIVINYEDKAWDIPEELPARTKYLICQHEEGKENGTEHIQGYIYFENQVRFKTVKKRLKCTWAHIEPAKGTPEDNKKYCSKEDTRLAGPWELGTLPKKGQRAPQPEWVEKAMNAETASEAREIYRQSDFRGFTRSYVSINKYLHDQYAPKVEEWQLEYPRESFKETDKMKEWAEQIGKKQRRCKVLLLISPQRYGKSEWARSLGKHVYQGNTWILKEFEKTPDFQYIVFDDMPADTQVQRNLLLGMNGVAVTDKYKGKTYVSCQGKPVVWLCNPTNRPNWANLPEYYEDDMIEEVLSEKLF